MLFRSPPLTIRDANFAEARQAVVLAVVGHVGNRSPSDDSPRHAQLLGRTRSDCAAVTSVQFLSVECGVVLTVSTSGQCAFDRRHPESSSATSPPKLVVHEDLQRASFSELVESLRTSKMCFIRSSKRTPRKATARVLQLNLPSKAKALHREHKGAPARV